MERNRETAPSRDPANARAVGPRGPSLPRAYIPFEPRITSATRLGGVKQIEDLHPQRVHILLLPTSSITPSSLSRILPMSA